jgi:hypothetical protein
MFGLVGIAMSLSANPCAADGDPFLGEINTFAFNFCPVGWAPSTAERLMAATEQRPSHCRQENRFSR